MNSLQNDNSETDTQQHFYAGFWLRVIAYFIDAFILFIPLSILEKLLSIEIPIVLYIFILWLYTSIFLSSQWHATPGKKLIGLEVYDEDLQPLTLKKASIRFAFSLISYAFILPIFMILFTQKQQTFHDYFAKTVVIDYFKAFAAEKDNTLHRQKQAKSPKIIRIIAGIIIFILIGYTLVLTVPTLVVFGMLYKNKTEAYNNSFHTTNKINDLNDSTIKFYNYELEQNTIPFIEADNMYTLFEFDVKKDLALSCIERLLKNRGEKNWINQGTAYRKNARNLYANNEEKIEKAKKNEKLMGRYFYIYDLNLVNHTIEDITFPWREKKTSPCENQLSVNTMYDTFLLNYIDDFSVSDKRSKKWIDLLKQKRPKAFINVEELHVKQSLQKEKRLKEQKIKDFKDAKKHLYICATKGYSGYSIRSIKESGVNLNMQFKDGQTALVLATIHHDLTIVNSLLFNGADIAITDNFGKTALDYVDKTVDPRIYMKLRIQEGINKAPKLDGTLQSTSTHYDEKTDTVTVKHYGENQKTWSPLIIAIENHENSEVEKYIKNREHLHSVTSNGSTPIFAAIKFKNNTALNLLIASQADLEAKNNFGMTPLFAAVISKNHYAIEILLQHGANMNQIDEHELYTPFTRAVSDNDLKAVTLFLDNNVDINYQYKKSETALTYAAKGCKNIEMFKLLLEHGANPDLMDTYKKTTKTGLLRYCRDKKDLQLFMESM